MGLQLEMLKLTLALLFIVVGLAYGTEYSPSFMEWLSKAPSSSSPGWNRHMDPPPFFPENEAGGYRYGKHGSYNKKLALNYDDKEYDKKYNKGYDKKYNKGYDKHSEESTEETKSYGGKKDKYGYDKYAKGSYHDKEYNKGYDKHSEESTEETKSSSPEKSYDKKSYGKKSYGKKSYGKKNKHYGSSRNWNPRNMDPPPFFPVYEDTRSIRGYRYGKGPKASRGIVSEEHGAEPWHGERDGNPHWYGNPYRTALDLGKDVDLGSIRLPGVAEPLTLRIKVQPDPNPSKPVEEPVPEEAAEETEKPTASRPAARGPWRHPGSTQGVIMGQPRGGGFR